MSAAGYQLRWLQQVWVQQLHTRVMAWLQHLLVVHTKCLLVPVLQGQQEPQEQQQQLPGLVAAQLLYHPMTRYPAPG